MCRTSWPFTVLKKWTLVRLTGSSTARTSLERASMGGASALARIADVRGAHSSLPW